MGYVQCALIRPIGPGSVSVVVTLVGVDDCSLSFLGAADGRSEAAIPRRQVAGAVGV